MKCYVQNGFNKRVLSAGNSKQAAKILLKGLLTPVNTDGDELAEFHPITMVSQCGFMEPMSANGMEKEFDDIQMFRTAKLFDSMRRKDIGDYIRGREKTLPKEKQKLLKLL